MCEYVMRTNGTVLAFPIDALENDFEISVCGDFMDAVCGQRSVQVISFAS